MNRPRRPASSARLRSLVRAIAVGTPLCAVLCGCLFVPGRVGLERLRQKRGEPWARTVFRAEPTDGERPLAELRASLSYWSEPGADGRRRAEGILVAEPADLHSRLIERIDADLSEVTLVAYRYDAAGNDDVTLVDYVGADGDLLGSDFVIYGEPETRVGGAWFVGYEDMAWWEYPQMLLDVPVYLVIGLKELALEIVKSPFSAVDLGVIAPLAERRAVVSPVPISRGGAAFVGDWRDGWSAFSWRFRARSRHTPLDLLRDLASAVPLVGVVFEYRSPPPQPEVSPSPRIVALSQGIHAGDETEQFLEAWRRKTEELRPGVDVVVDPYFYGGVFDVAWSLFGLSHGFGYDWAEQLVFGRGVRSGEAVDLMGFSGGVQRAAAASRALRRAGVRVESCVGLAGPMTGGAAASRAELLLGDDLLADPVVMTARLTNALFFLVPSGVEVRSVPRGGGHHIPWFPDARTRAPQTAYAAALAGDGGGPDAATIEAGVEPRFRGTLPDRVGGGGDPRSSSAKGDPPQ